MAISTTTKTIVSIVVLAVVAVGVYWFMSMGNPLPNNNPNAQAPTTPVGGQGKLPTQTITVGSTTLTVEMAITQEAKEAGLSGRPGLAENTGMLFVFETEDVYQFWMKDMLFSTDMLWITSDGTISHIAANATPESYTQNPPQTFGPTTPALYVLEVPAGWAAAHNVVVGAKVVL